ncbi:Fur family transcriptional regulator [Orenia marismortui]|uniref:Fur family ferric uptake transcriptional regulator n=1 Tax=Orenia marismortui TaxID=46469 RepID=A0A4R8GSL4_9FIRM|nr:transcriptional repressor [Orenia marismortui]TDX48951.1 Fur family ferric uptake transcriptional regulator [Orenia marismortui]
MEKTLKNLKSILAANNYKLTSQRKLILDILLNNEGEHLSAEEVYNIVKKEDPGIGLATVYRTLELFCELGITQQLNFDDNCRRYELDTGEDHHHHLVCSKCGKVTEFNDKILEEFEKDLQIKHKFKVTDHRIKFYGYCEECQ